MNWDLLNVTSRAEREANWRQWLDVAASIGKEVFVAEVSGRIVGFAVIGPKEDGGANSRIAELDRIYIEPSQWQRGIGKELFRKCLEWVQQRRYKEICVWTLEGNVRARRFYEALGFKWDGVKRKIGPYPEDVRYSLHLG